MRGTPDWQQRVWTRLGNADRERSPVDRIVLHAISPGIVQTDPDEPGTVGLGSLAAADLGAMSARRHRMSQRYRAESSVPLFPTDPDTTAHHVIVASTSLDKAEAQQFLQTWQAQTMNCEPREDFALCHAPNFALSFYSSHSLVLEVELNWFCQEVTFTVGNRDSVTCLLAVDTAAAAALRKLLRQTFSSVQTEEDRNPAYFHEWRN